MNVLKPHLRITIATLLRERREPAGDRAADGRGSQDDPAVRAAANSPGVATGSAGDAEQIPPPRPPAPAGRRRRERRRASRTGSGSRRRSRLGRNAQSIYQDLVERHGFAHRYNSVKRFVAGAARRASRSASTCWSTGPARKRRSTTARAR